MMQFRRVEEGALNFNTHLSAVNIILASITHVSLHLGVGSPLRGSVWGNLVLSVLFMCFQAERKDNPPLGRYMFVTHAHSGLQITALHCRCVPSEAHTPEIMKLVNPSQVEELAHKVFLLLFKAIAFFFSLYCAGDLDYYWLDPATWHSRETSPISSVSIQGGRFGSSRKMWAIHHPLLTCDRQ